MKCMLRIKRWANHRLQEAGKSDKAKMPNVGLTLVGITYGTRKDILCLLSVYSDE